MRAQNVGTSSLWKVGLGKELGAESGGRGEFGACRGWICFKKAGLEEDS